MPASKRGIQRVANIWGGKRTIEILLFKAEIRQVMKNFIKAQSSLEY